MALKHALSANILLLEAWRRKLPCTWKPKFELLNMYCTTLQWYFVSKLVLTFCEKKIVFSDWEQLLELEAEDREFAKFLKSLNRTIYSDSESLKQFWKK